MKKIKNQKVPMMVLYVGVVLVLIFVIWNVYQYFRLKSTAEYYLNVKRVVSLEEPVDLVGLLDSYGVPYSPSVDKSFLGYIEEDLKNQGKLSSSLDMYGLYINKTWEMEGLFRNDVTIGEVTTMQNFGLDFVRHKYGDERIRNDLVYECGDDLQNMTVASYYSSLNRPTVLYSCAANDLFYYFDMSLETLSLSKMLKNALNFGKGLSLLESEVEKNLETLNQYNPNAVILVMGVYVPSKNFFIQRGGNVIVNRVNKLLKKVCERHPNAVYVDVSCLSFAVLDGDFHPNNNGQIILKNILENAMETHELEKHQEGGITAVLEYQEPDPNTIHYSDEITANELLQWVEQLDLPKRDYVEWAVAAEETLYENGFSDISLQALENIMEVFDLNENERAYRGIEVLTIERKICKGYDMSKFTINKDIRNDKLSLITYFLQLE